MKYRKVEQLNSDSNDDTTQQASSLSSSSNTIRSMNDDDDDDDNVNRPHQQDHTMQSYYSMDNVPQHHPDTIAYGIPTTNNNDIPNPPRTVLYHDENENDNENTIDYDDTTTSHLATDGMTRDDHNYHYQTRPNSLHLDTESTIPNNRENNPHRNINDYYYTSWMTSIILGIGLLFYIKRKNDTPSPSSSRLYPVDTPRMNDDHNNDENDEDYYYEEDNQIKNEKSSTITMIQSFIQSSILYTWMELLYDEIFYSLSYCYMQYQMMVEYISRTMILIYNNIHWIWQYCTNASIMTTMTTITNPILRQQRMDYYYNTTTGTTNQNSRNSDIQYYNHTSLRLSNLPDLVEGGIRDINDDDGNDGNNSDLNGVAVSSHSAEPSTTTNMVNHFDDGITEGRNSVIDRMNEQSHVELLHTSTSSNRIALETKSNIPPSRTWNSNHHDLEPAFVNEMDYPSNWMVYHPILQRVILKVHADAYNQKMMMMMNQEPQSSIIYHSSNDETATTTTTTTTTNQPVLRQSVMAT